MPVPSTHVSDSFLQHQRASDIVSLRTRRTAQDLAAQRSSVVLTSTVPSLDPVAEEKQTVITEFLPEDSQMTAASSSQELYELARAINSAAQPQLVYPAIQRLFTLSTSIDSGNIAILMQSGIQTILLRRLSEPAFFDDTRFLGASAAILARMTYCDVITLTEMIKNGLIDFFQRTLSLNVFSLQQNYCLCMGNIVFTCPSMIPLLTTGSMPLHKIVIGLISITGQADLDLLGNVVWVLCNICMASKSENRQSNPYLQHDTAEEIFDFLMAVTCNKLAATPINDCVRRQCFVGLSSLIGSSLRLAQRMLDNTEFLSIVYNTLGGENPKGTTVAARIVGLLALHQQPQISERLIHLHFHFQLAAACERFFPSLLSSPTSNIIAAVSDSAWALSNIISVKLVVPHFIDGRIIPLMLSLCPAVMPHRVRTEASWVIINTVHYAENEHINVLVKEFHLIPGFAYILASSDAHSTLLAVQAFQKVFKAALMLYGENSPIFNQWVSEFQSANGIQYLYTIQCVQGKGRQLSQLKNEVCSLLQLLGCDDAFASADASSGDIDFMQTESRHMTACTVPTRNGRPIPFTNKPLPVPPHGEPVYQGKFARFLAVVYFTVCTIFTGVWLLLFSWHDRGQRAVDFFVRHFMHAELTVIGNEELRHTHKGFILLTHKSWGDFPTMSFFGMASCLARKAVAFAVPFIYIANLRLHVIHYFNRDCFKTSSRGKFNKGVLRMFDKNPRLLIFVEGSRAFHRGTLGLRTGMLRVAFNNGVSVLVAPCEGAQYVFNERLGIRPWLRGPKRHYVLNCVAQVNPVDFPPENDSDEAKEAAFQRFLAHITELFEQGYTEACAEYDRIISREMSLGVNTFPKGVAVSHDQQYSRETCVKNGPADEPAADTQKQ